MSIKKKIVLSVSTCLLIVLAAVGVYVYGLFNTPLIITDEIIPVASMDLQIYLSDTIVLAKVVSDNNNKMITCKEQTQNGEKTYIKLVTDTQLEIKEVYKGDITDGSTITYRGNYGKFENLEISDISKNPNFNIGEEFIIFLQKNNESNTYNWTLGPQSKFIYDEANTKYIGKYLTFENINTEIERYNNTSETERDLPQGSINSI